MTTTVSRAAAMALLTSILTAGGYDTSDEEGSLAPLLDVKQPLTDPTQRKNIEIWVSALRSGVYPQSTGALYVSPNDAEVTDADEPGYPVGFCCLGVYSNVVDNVPLVCLTNVGTLPAVHDRRVINGPQPMMHTTFPLVAYSEAFAELNDNYKATFKQIADIVEGLFLSDTEKIAPPKPEPPKRPGVLKYHPATSEKVNEIAARLNVAFTWSESPQGQEYWSKVSENLRKIANEIRAYDLAMYDYDLAMKQYDHDLAQQGRR